VVEETTTGFLGVWNPVLASFRQRTGVPFPHLEFSWWLTVLILTVGALAALTPLVYRGVRWLRPASYVFASVMIANGIHHLLSPLYLGRFLPGQYTSPLLIFASAWLILKARQARPLVALGPSSFAPIAGTAAFFVAAPMTVAGWVPYALTGWDMAPVWFGVRALRVLGGVTIVFGAGVLIECFTRFALVGRGTPAPVAPTETLVVSGAYRYVRNPMYVAVLAAIAGQALLLGSVTLLVYGAIVWLAAHAFVVSYEEPALQAQFGASFDAYRTHVPRWIPRISPWTAQDR
jgi:protein-S-isoprenylcysteine O-methyltransferase Ste14